MSIPTRVALLASLLPLAAKIPAQGRSLESRSSPLTISEPDERDRTLRTTPVVRAVQKAADAVVSVYIQHPTGLAGGSPVTEGQGSGVILDEGGFVITNWHVVAPIVLGQGYQAQVRLRDGRTRAARVLSSSADHDLALLQMDLQAGEKVHPVEIGRSADLMIGETTVAIGNPQGHANTVTSGVLSATGRSIRVRAPDGVVREYKELLQTDAAINQGNSGGALLDITGKLIGINNAMAMGAENIGFAIPVDTVRQVFESELIRSGSFADSADAAWLGLQIEERESGLLVRDVLANSPAAEAGIQKGDTIVTVAESPVRSMLDYARRMLSANPGSSLDLTVTRGGARRKLQLHPATRQDFLLSSMTGITVEEISAEQDPDLVRRATQAFYQGRGYGRVPLLPAVLRVKTVLPDTPAQSLGLQRGDVILSVVGYDPRNRIDRDLFADSPRTLTELLRQKAGTGAKLVVLRGNQDLTGVLDVRKTAFDGYR
jgi:serine protease Do